MDGKQMQELTPVERLFEILEGETELCRQLIDLLDQEQTALTTMDLKWLLAISSKKHNLVEKILRLDQHIQKIARLLVDESGDKVIKLSALESFVSEHDLVRLRKYQEEMIKMRRMIQDCNIVNKKFAEDTLGYLGDAISLISSPGEENGIYEDRGRTRGMANGPSLISQEV